MRYTLKAALVAALAVSAGGCTDDRKPLTQPPMVIASGFIRMDSGRIVQIIGFDNCDKAAEGFQVVGRIEAKTKGCVLVSPTAQQFSVTVGTSKGMRVERWDVVKTQSELHLLRPDGDRATVLRLVN